MKDRVFCPSLNNENVIVEYTDNFILDKKTKIFVPNQYKAVIFDNEKIAFRVEPSSEKTIYKEYGKDFLSHQMRIAFLRVKAIPDVLWGFGHIQVKNDKLNEAYEVGANGSCHVNIVDYTKIVNSFPMGKDITIDMLQEKIRTTVNTIGTPIVSMCFANTDISVFEIDSLIGWIRKELQEGLNNDEKIKNLGIRLGEVTVAGIHVDENDLELIKNRINNILEIDDVADSNPDDTKSYQDDLDRLQNEIFAKLSEEIAASELRNRTENERRIAEGISKNRRATVETVLEYVKGQFDEFGKTIANELDERIQELLPLQDAAKAENTGKLKVTAESLIANAQDDDDYVMAAARIYSNVEDNLIHKFDLWHEDERFLIDYREYLSIAANTVIGNKYLLKHKNPNGSYSVAEPRVYEKDSEGNPKVVEMFPIVRFIKAGLSPVEAKCASTFWMMLNKIRHKSDENAEKVREILSQRNVSKQEYLLAGLKFFKEKGLYTKD